MNADTLPDPVPTRDVAAALGVSLDTVYASMRRFRSAVRRGDTDAARNEIPNLQIGLRRYVVPKPAFLAYYSAAGVAPELVRELWGGDAA